MYVIRLSCELPYAVGVRKNTAQSITRRQRKQSKKADHIGVFRGSMIGLTVLLNRLSLSEVLRVATNTEATCRSNCGYIKRLHMIMCKMHSPTRTLKKGLFSVRTAIQAKKRKLLNFVCSNSTGNLLPTGFTRSPANHLGCGQSNHWTLPHLTRK